MLFKNNRFLPSAHIKDYGLRGSGFSQQRPLFSSRWGNKLVREVGTSPRLIVDVFDRSWHLLTSHEQGMTFGVCSSEGHGTLWRMGPTGKGVTIVRTRRLLRERRRER